MYRENRLKKTLKKGGNALGCWCTFNDSLMSEMLALCGFDFTLFDHEHTPASFENLIAQLHAISATPTTSIVRVPGNDRLYIKRTLDAGAEGIMIPNVDTADDARSIVDACRYPPAGRRGTGINTIRASNFGMAGGYAGYGRTANDDLLIICQIESPEGVGNAEEIAGVHAETEYLVRPGEPFVHVTTRLRNEADQPARVFSYGEVWMRGGRSMRSFVGDTLSPERSSGFHHRNFDRKNIIGLHHLALTVDGPEALNALHGKLSATDEVEVDFAPESLGGGPTQHMICAIPGGIRVEFIAPAG